MWKIPWGQTQHTHTQKTRGEWKCVLHFQSSAKWHAPHITSLTLGRTWSLMSQCGQILKVNYVFFPPWSGSCFLTFELLALVFNLGLKPRLNHKSHYTADAINVNIIITEVVNKSPVWPYCKCLEVKMIQIIPEMTNITFNGIVKLLASEATVSAGRSNLNQVVQSFTSCFVFTSKWVV